MNAPRGLKLQGNLEEFVSARLCMTAGSWSPLNPGSSPTARTTSPTLSYWIGTCCVLPGIIWMRLGFFWICLSYCFMYMYVLLACIHAHSVSASYLRRSEEDV